MSTSWSWEAASPASPSPSRSAGHGSVLVLTKRQRSEGSTQYAQGGIASVLGADDQFELHVEDTLVAGAGLCNREAVEVTVREGPERIRWLLSLGVEFDREGAASTSPARAATRAAASPTPRTPPAARWSAPCWRPATPRASASSRTPWRSTWSPAARSAWAGRTGCWAPTCSSRETGAISTVSAGVTVLATGGAGKVYLYTTNPDVATGDGVAMAYRAGAAIANMEFYQFHPTGLYHPQAKSFLISEALRGEGGILRNAAGEAFMARYDPRKELAPRDIVARSIDAEIKRRGDDCVFLDMTHLPKAFLLEHFPYIHATIKEFGMDMTVQPIPVVPVAHYMCGGVVTDLMGRTSLPGLFAIGEVACTGLHGANRLASNSLLEGLVFGRRAALRAADALADNAGPTPPIPDWNPGDALAPDEGVVVAHNWDEVRRTMWNYVGIVRTQKRLERARSRIALLRTEIREYYWQYQVTPDLVELRNLADVAMLVVECARHRKESRGLHYVLDYPGTDERQRRDTVMTLGDLEPAPLRRGPSGRLRGQPRRGGRSPLGAEVEHHRAQPAGDVELERPPRQRRAGPLEAHPVDHVERIDVGEELADGGVGGEGGDLRRPARRTCAVVELEVPDAGPRRRGRWRAGRRCRRPPRTPRPWRPRPGPVASACSSSACVPGLPLGLAADPRLAHGGREPGGRGVGPVDEAVVERGPPGGLVAQLRPSRRRRSRAAGARWKGTPAAHPPARRASAAAVSEAAHGRKSLRVKRARSGTPVASMASRPPSSRSTSARQATTSSRSARHRSMALSAEPPVVTTSSRTMTRLPSGMVLRPSIHCPVPCPLGSLRTMKASTGCPSRKLVRAMALAMGSAPSVSPPTPRTSGCTRSTSASRQRPMRTCPSAVSAVRLQSM